MILSNILGLTNDQLLAELYGDAPVRRWLLRTTAPSSNAQMAAGSKQALAEVKRAGERLRELMPDATVTITISYGGQ